MTMDRLGKYEIRGILGKGAMGTVYSAWDPIISRQVAIKTVRLPDAADIDAQEELARFKREAQAAGRLTHPNIVGIFDYGETDEVAYIVMEFVDGQTLKSVLDGEGRMSVATVGKIMADLLAGLRYSHDRGVVHRDIKPANVMIVGGDGHGSGQAKIADFGIARIESSNLTQAGTIMGTPAYMSPEQFMGQTVDARTDIYSSGVLLFQLLTGERPFEGSMATIMHKALNTLPPKPSELSVTAPVALDAVVARAMARRPDDRFPDSASFADAIAAALEGRAPAAEDGLGMGLGDDLDSESTVVRPTASHPAGRPATRQAPPPTRKPDAAGRDGARPRARSKAPLLAGVAFVALAAAGTGGAWWAGLIGTPEPSNAQIAGAQIAGATSIVTPRGKPPNPVVAVSPPSAPDAVPPAQTAEARQTSEPVATPAAPPALPPPRTDVTQVVPPSTSSTARSSTPPTTQPAQIVPPAAPSPAPARTGLAGAPPLEPAQVAPPVTASVPRPEPRQAETRPGTRTEVAPNTRVEPAVVTPPASATITPATVPPPRPDRIEPPTAPATTVTESSSTAPTAAVTPSPIRPPEPQVATRPPPAQATIPPGTSTAPPTGATPTSTTPTTTLTATPPVVTPPVVTPPTVTAAIVSPEALRRAVTAAAQGAECAAVRGDLSRSGIISVQGVIGQGGPSQDLLHRIREAAPTAPLDWSVAEVIGPYCGALNLVRPYTRAFGSTSGGMDVALKDGRTNLREDDEIDLVAQTPSFPSYLQLDYFSSDGSVLHVQTSAQGSPAFPSRSSQSYRPGSVAPPFGTDLVVSIASSVPLFSKGQALPDQAEPYLRQLRAAMDSAVKRRAELAAGVVVVQTSPKS